MSQADELLDSLFEDEVATYSIDPATEPHILIDEDKAVTVPDDLKHIAVQGEHNVETVTFDCPRYWDGHDLSRMSMRIVYQRADGHREPHPVENLRVDDVDENIIHFDWTVSGNVTAVKGNVSFMVCAKLSDAEGNRVREWHSRLNQELIVDEGMECSGEEIVERNPDILEAILVQLDHLESTGGVTDEQIANAVDAYLRENPIEAGVDEQEVRNIIAAYLEENPPEGGTITDEQIANAVATYLAENPVEVTNVVKTVNGVSPDNNGNVEITIPDSGQNVELDTTLTQSGKAADAKAVGDALAELEGKIPEGGGTTDYAALTNKPSINGVALEGNKTAEELGITGMTDDQVRTALDGYLTDNPDAIVTGATPEQVAQIEFATATDAALFATLETGSLYEADLTGWGWANNRMLALQGTWWDKDFAVEGNRYSSNGCIHLRRGDVLITNADTPVHGATTTRIGCLLQKMTAYTSNYNQGTFLMEGRGKFDGLYRCYTAVDAEEYIRVSYKYDVDYDVHFYVAKARADAEVIPFTYVSGYIKADTGAVFEASETDKFMTGYNSEVVSELITLQAPGKFLLVKNIHLDQSVKGAYIWAKYGDDGAFQYGLFKGRWNRNYCIVPLIAETENIRLNFRMIHNPTYLTEALLVDAEYLVRNGYADHMAGKSLSMFGDSYVGGHSLGAWRTWHYMFAEQHQMQYYNHGTNGLGLVKSPNIGDGMIDRCATVTEADYIGVICGRNDYSVQVPMGTNDDVSTPEMGIGNRTFKGGLNYLCQYLVEHFPDKKVFFLTPWFFPSRTDIEETIKPKEYIDAILEITGLWGIPCFDAARRSGIHVRSEAFRGQYFLSASDVSHLNEEGAKLMMNNITSWMLAL